MANLIKIRLLVILSMVITVIPIQLELQQGEEIKENYVEDSPLNDCLQGSRSSEMGVCFSKELLKKLNDYNEADTFSLANGVSFVRDEKTPRDFPNFLDKDPVDYRAIMEDASNLIAKRSLRWDLNNLYPGLAMTISPTLANGILEFVIDPRIKDRSYYSPHQPVSTVKLVARNLLVPFLLGFKFHMSTLLPLFLGLLLLATKKAFLLAKLALLAITAFASSSNPWSSSPWSSWSSNPWSSSSWSTSPWSSGPWSSSYSTYPHHHHSHHSDYHHGHTPHDHYYKEKSSEQTTAAPITPEEIRDRFERYFVTKKDENIDENQDEVKIRNGRNFVWTPIPGR